MTMTEMGTVSNEADMLRNAFERQRALQAEILGQVEHPGRIIPLLIEALAHDYLVGLIMEAGEGLKAMRTFPSWDRHQTDFDGLRAEVVDQFHHVINLAWLLWQNDPQAFYDAYVQKWERNFARAKERNERNKPYPYKREGKTEEMPGHD